MWGGEDASLGVVGMPGWAAPAECERTGRGGCILRDCWCARLGCGNWKWTYMGMDGAFVGCVDAILRGGSRGGGKKAGCSMQVRVCAWVCVCLSLAVLCGRRARAGASDLEQWHPILSPAYWDI
eukprot:352630-Chlamydomonas_euryale.AAC.6